MLLRDIESVMLDRTKHHMLILWVQIPLFPSHSPNACFCFEVQGPYGTGNPSADIARNLHALFHSHVTMPVLRTWVVQCVFLEPQVIELVKWISHSWDMNICDGDSCIRPWVAFTVTVYWLSGVFFWWLEDGKDMFECDLVFQSGWSSQLEKTRGKFRWQPHMAYISTIFYTSRLAPGGMQSSDWVAQFVVGKSSTRRTEGLSLIRLLMQSFREEPSTSSGQWFLRTCQSSADSS